jgi:hypothetical protein
MLPYTVTPDSDAYDATDKHTIEFLWFTADPECARAQFGDVATCSALTRMTSKSAPPDTDLTAHATPRTWQEPPPTTTGRVDSQRHREFCPGTPRRVRHPRRSGGPDIRVAASSIGRSTSVRDRVATHASAWYMMPALGSASRPADQQRRVAKWR